MDEFSLINKIKEKLKGADSRVLLGIGDDCAVLVPPKGNLLTTTDCLMESVHFDLSFMTPEELGHKALAINLSDIAAMGGTPLYALVSLGIRKGMSEEFILKMFDGMKNCAGMFETAIVGGNITYSPEKFFVDITLIGEGGKYWTRSGANDGDVIAVTGKLGGGACGLRLLKKDAFHAKSKYARLASSHLMPIPRILEAKVLMSLGAVTSAIDVSDGLSSELQHLSKASGLGMEIEEDKIPYASGMEEACTSLGEVPLELALNGGEDYELLLTISSDKISTCIAQVRALGTKLTPIGIVTSKHSSVLITNSQKVKRPLDPKGWTHF